MSSAFKIIDTTIGSSRGGWESWLSASVSCFLRDPRGWCWVIAHPLGEHALIIK